MLPTPYPAHNPSLTEPFPALGPTSIQNRHLHMPAELREVQRPSVPRDAGSKAQASHSSGPAPEV